MVKDLDKLLKKMELDELKKRVVQKLDQLISQKPKRRLDQYGEEISESVRTVSGGRPESKRPKF